MIKLEEMGTILMHIALQYTHPDFESMYSDWSTVHDIGEKLVKMSDQPQLNENQQMMSEAGLIGVIYSQLLEEFGFGYINKDLWMIAENLSEKIANEQPQLNENQQNLIIWMQDNECYTDDPLESISDLFLEGTPSDHFLDLPLSCVEAAYQSLTNQQKVEMVQKYLEQYLEQEEE